MARNASGTPAPAPMPVHEYIEKQLYLSGKSQREVADALGYKNQNIISVFKNGKSKVPVNKVGALATVLGIDKKFFLHMVMNEYMPDVWKSMMEILSDEIPQHSANDVQTLNVIREATKGIDLDLGNPDNAKILQTALVKIAERDAKLTATRLEKFNALPNVIRHAKTNLSA